MVYCIIVDRKTNHVVNGGHTQNPSGKANADQIAFEVDEYLPGYWSVDMKKLVKLNEPYKFTKICIRRKPTSQEIDARTTSAIGNMENQINRVMQSIIGERSTLRSKKLDDAETLMSDAAALAPFVRNEASALEIPPLDLARQIIVAAAADDAILSSLETLRRVTKIALENVDNIEQIEEIEKTHSDKLSAIIG